MEKSHGKFQNLMVSWFWAHSMSLKNMACMLTSGSGKLCRVEMQKKFIFIHVAIYFQNCDYWALALWSFYL